MITEKKPSSWQTIGSAAPAGLFRPSACWAPPGLLK